MHLEPSELVRMGSFIARHYQPPKIKITETTIEPKQKKKVEKKIVTRPQKEYLEMDKGPSSNVWIVPVIGVFFIIFTLIFFDPSPLFVVMVIVLCAFAFWIATLKWRNIEIQEVVQNVESEEMVENIIEVPGKTLLEETAIPNEEQVIAIGRTIFRFYAVPWQNGMLLLDANQVFDSEAVRLNHLIDRPAMIKEMENVEKLTSHIPYILNSERAAYTVTARTAFGEQVILRGEEKELNEAYTRVFEFVNGAAGLNFEPRLIPGNCNLDLFNPFFTSVPMAPVQPEIINAIANLKALHEERTSRFLPDLSKFIKQTSARHLSLHGVRFSSLNGQVAPICFLLASTFHYSAFNFYCPSCNHETVEMLLHRDYNISNDVDYEGISYASNTRCYFDPEQETWHCPTCDAVTTQPIPVHKMLDEALMPAYDRLMDENKNERLRIYGETRSQEINYNNKMEGDIDNLFMRNQESIDLLTDEKQRLEAEMLGEETAITSFQQVMANYNINQSAGLKRMEKQRKELIEEIDRERRSVQASLEQVFDKEREDMISTLQKYSRAKRLEDERRDAIFLNMAHNLHRTATATENIQDGVQKMDAKLGVISENTGRIAQYTERTANATEATAKNTQSMNEKLDHIDKNTSKQTDYAEKTMAINSAMAQRLGVGRHRNRFDIAGHFHDFTSNIASDFLNEDAVDRAKRKEEA